MCIRFQNVSYAYTADRPVLQDFSMEIPHGITLLKGYSGCGKSTLLRLIAGFLTPDSGRVTVPPNSVAPSRSFHKRSLGFVFQEINLLPDATVLRNVRLACALAGIEIGAEEKEKQIRWFRRLGLEALTERKVKTLSGGQKQRAAVARAIIKDPLVLCLDEPPGSTMPIPISSNARFSNSAVRRRLSSSRVTTRGSIPLPIQSSTFSHWCPIRTREGSKMNGTGL